MNLNGSASFQCSSSKEVEWYFSPSGELAEQTLIHNEHNLKISSVDLGDAGYYFCYGFNTKVKRPFMATGHLKIYGES